MDPMPNNPVLGTDTTTQARADGAAVIRRMALNLIIKQMMTEDIEVSASNGVVWMARYEAVYGVGKRPKYHANCNNAQLGGLERLKSNDLAPYVDMAIWGPFHSRIVKKLRFMGKFINEQGIVETKEVYGPPNVTTWNACQKPMKTGFIMTDILDLGSIDEHADMINTFHSQYGDVAWLLILSGRCQIQARALGTDWI